MQIAGLAHLQAHVRGPTQEFRGPLYRGLHTRLIGCRVHQILGSVTLCQAENLANVHDSRSFVIVFVICHRVTNLHLCPLKLEMLEFLCPVSPFHSWQDVSPWLKSRIFPGISADLPHSGCPMEHGKELIGACSNWPQKTHLPTTTTTLHTHLLSRH